MERPDEVSCMIDEIFNLLPVVLVVRRLGMFHFEKTGYRFSSGEHGDDDAEQDPRAAREILQEILCVEKDAAVKYIRGCSPNDFDRHEGETGALRRVTETSDDERLVNMVSKLYWHIYGWYRRMFIHTR